MSLLDRHLMGRRPKSAAAAVVEKQPDVVRHTYRGDHGRAQVSAPSGNGRGRRG